MTYHYTPDESVELLRSAIAEIKARLELGDVESASSICTASEIALIHGCESSEFKAHAVIEGARFS